MTAPVRIAAFVAALAAVFVVALWAGQAFGPQPAAPQPSTGQHSHPTGGHTP